MRSKCFLIIAWVGLSIESAAATPMDAEALKSELRQQLKSEEDRSIDQFAEPPRLTVNVGDRFRVEYAFRDGRRKGYSSTDGHFIYESGILTLELNLLEYTGPLVDGKITPHRSIDDQLEALKNNTDSSFGVHFGASVAEISKYTGQNSFGVEALVSVKRSERFGIIADKYPDPPYFKYWPEYVYKARLAGEDARKLSGSARIVIEGVITSLPSGDVAACERPIYSEPTIDSPDEVHFYECYVAGDIRRILFLDQETGNVLASWN